MTLFAGYPLLADRINADTLRAYMQATAGCSAWAVGKVLEAFGRGRLEGADPNYCPSAPLISAHAAKWDEAKAYIDQAKLSRVQERLVSYAIGSLPPAGAEPLGPIKVNLGHGDIDLSGKTFAEKEAIIKGEIDSGADKIDSFKPPAMKRMTD